MMNQCKTEISGVSDIQDQIRNLSSKHRRAIQDKFALQIVVNTYENLLERLDGLSLTAEESNIYRQDEGGNLELYHDMQYGDNGYQSTMSPINTNFIQTCMELHQIALKDFENYIDILEQELNRLMEETA